MNLPMLKTRTFDAGNCHLVGVNSAAWIWLGFQTGASFNTALSQDAEVGTAQLVGETLTRVSVPHPDCGISV